MWTKEDWPGNSPDINPVEKIWSILKEKVFATPYCKTLPQLTHRVQLVWQGQDLDQDKALLASLVDKNWTDRVSQVIDHHGDNNFK